MYKYIAIPYGNFPEIFPERRLHYPLGLMGPSSQRALPYKSGLQSIPYIGGNGSGQ